MSYVKVSGERSDGFRYVQGGYVYLKDTTKNGNEYLKCSEEACFGTAVIRANSSALKVNRQHNHDPRKEHEEVTLFRHSLREKAKTGECPGFRNLFDAESARYPVGSLLRGFPQDEQLMRRSRNSCTPPRPMNLDELHDILNLQPKWRHHALAMNSEQEFFVETRHVDNAANSRVSVMVSPYFSDLLTMDRIDLAMDGTFDTRPQFPVTEQLLSIHAFEMIGDRRYCWPCAYVLMEMRDEPSYTTALQCVNESVGGTMNPRSLMADYEKAPHNSARRLFPGIETSGCWFHYCNALWGEVQHLQLLDVVNHDTNAEKCIQKCMALPLLPPGEVENGLIIIEEDAQEALLTASLRPYFQYIRNYWLNDSYVGVDTLSVFELDVRTNNCVEKSHYDLFNKCGTVRPSIWRAYDAMKKYDLAQHQDRQRARNEVPIRRRRRHEYTVQDDNIREMQTSLTNGDIDTAAFLSRACHSVEGLQRRLKKHYRQRRGDADQDE